MQNHSRRGVTELLIECQPLLCCGTVAPTGSNTSVSCALLLSPQNELSGAWHSGYIRSSGIVSFQLTPLMGWGMLSPSGDGANLSSGPGTHPRMASSSATPQTANMAPGGPGPPKHCTHQRGLGLQNPLSRMIQVQDISLNCVLEKNVVIWATKE